jgi:hypothetical protein
MTNLNQLLIERLEEDELEKEKLELYQNLQDLAIINKHLTQYLLESAPKIEEIRDNITISTVAIDRGTEDLRIANDYSFKFLPVILGVTVGVIVGGPLGLIPGFKVGGLIAAGGLGVVGGITGYQIQK